MLRFFRKYLLNKWVLALGGSLLMVVFLLPMGQGGMGGGKDPLVGRMGPEGEKIRASDLENARAQLEVLSRLSPVLRLTATTVPEETMQWLLMTRAAERLGLSTSEEQALVLLGELGQNAREPAEVARRIGVSQAFVIHTLRQYGAVTLYKELVFGQDHTPLQDRVRQYMRVAMTNGLDSVPQAQLLFPPRVSDPLIERFVYDQTSRIQAAMLRIPAGRYLDQAPPADPQRVAALFEQHRNDLPGASEPYGLGYREPRRVKFEYLTLPAERLAAKVTITEAEALAYFSRNRDSFPGVEAGLSNADAYPKVREQVISRYRREQSDDLGQRIVTRARAMMLEDLRQFDRVDGYLQIPADYQPMPLAAVADGIEREFGLRPNVSIRDSQWQTESELAIAPGIGGAWLVSERISAPFPAYAMSVREVEPAADHGLLVERLQAKTPSRGVTAVNGDYFLFRIIDAAPERSPASLDEVRERVEADVRILAAYERLIAESGTWLQRAREEGIEALAREMGVALTTPPAFTRYEMTLQGTLDVPMIEGVGRSPSLVRQVFTAADGLIGAEPVSTRPEAARLLAAPVASQLGLYLVRIDAVTAPTAAELNAQAASPAMPMLVGYLLRPQTAVNPLSIELLSKQLQFIGEFESARDEGEAETESEQDQNTPRTTGS